MTNQQEELIKKLLYRGLKIRTGLFIFGLICGILVGPGFSILGIILGGNSGPLLFWMGVVMTMLMITLIWLIYRENKDKQVVIKSINTGSGIDKIFLVKIIPQAAGAEGITARKLLKPFYHLFINHQDGYSVRFYLPRENSFQLFSLLINKFPKVQHSYPQEYLSYIPGQNNLPASEKYINQKQANSEMTQAEIKRITKIR